MVNPQLKESAINLHWDAGDNEKDGLFLEATKFVPWRYSVATRARAAV